MAESSGRIYHEKQRLQLCLLHTLNNLFQTKGMFTREVLNSIAERLDIDDPIKRSSTPLSLIFKPRYNSITGNYDINVLIAAIEEKGKTVVWHDRRKEARMIGLEDGEGKLMGMVLNVPARRFLGLWKSRHWFALRKIDGVWLNLDSDLPAPYSFKCVGELRRFLDDVIAGGGEILLVMDEIC